MSGEAKLHAYVGVWGRAREAWLALRGRCARWAQSAQWAEWGPRLQRLSLRHPAPQPANDDFSHIYRRKTAWELGRLSAAVMGLEFSYAAETAFVSPLLLQLRVERRVMTLAWALSPLVGFFLTPVLGSLSDRCRSPFGRRRPFVVLLSAGVLIGLLLVPNGAALGAWLGDARRWGALLTVAGTVLLDFDADACQSPARAYLLDVTLAEDHARGLAAFTVMAGLGGCMGYALGAVDWDSTAIGRALGGHVRAVFSLVALVLVVCVAATVSSFREVPLPLLRAQEAREAQAVRAARSRDEYAQLGGVDCAGGGAGAHAQRETSFCERPPSAVEVTAETGAEAEAKVEVEVQAEAEAEAEAEEEGPSLREYLLSIVFMPAALRVLCITNLFSWMAHVCYSLYFTDYVGEAVFEGDPKAEEGTAARDKFDAGVRFGCWGMSLYSLSCACYSLVIERLIQRFRARRVYVGGLLVFATGMLLMAACRHRVAVILFSCTAGVMYSTLFTMPYLLVAHYHSEHTLEGPGAGPRGLGTDVAAVGSMVFVAQLLLSCALGSVVAAAGSTTAVVAAAAVLALCGAIAASRVLYLDL